MSIDTVTLQIIMQSQIKGERKIEMMMKYIVLQRIVTD
jgi:hypothetical protein